MIPKIEDKEFSSLADYLAVALAVSARLPACVEFYGKSKCFKKKIKQYNLRAKQMLNLRQF